MQTQFRGITLSMAGALLVVGTTAGVTHHAEKAVPQRVVLTAATSYAPGSINLMDCPSLVSIQGWDMSCGFRLLKPGAMGRLRGRG